MWRARAPTPILIVPKKPIAKIAEQGDGGGTSRPPAFDRSRSGAPGKTDHYRLVINNGRAKPGRASSTSTCTSSVAAIFLAPGERRIAVKRGLCGAERKPDLGTPGNPAGPKVFIFRGVNGGELGRGRL